MNHPVPPNLGPKKKAAKRFFGGLLMPPVGHTPGKVPDELDPPKIPESWPGRWMLVGFVGGLVSGFLLFYATRIGAKKTCSAPGGACTCGDASKRKNPERVQPHVLPQIEKP